MTGEDLSKARESQLLQRRGRVECLAFIAQIVSAVARVYLLRSRDGGGVPDRDGWYLAPGRNGPAALRVHHG